ncbi:efflux RND transporter permease subunit [Bacteroidota bacterium]
MKIPKIAIQNYQFTIVIFLLVTLFGIISYFTMPKSEDPYMDYNVTTVLVINPGASPEDMETLVAEPLEESFNEIEGIDKITSRISDGIFYSFVEFEYGEDYDKKHQEVLQKINEKRDELPETIIRLEAMQPSVLDVCIYQLAFVSEGATPAEVKKEAEDLKRKIEKVNGVRGVELSAEQDLEVRITVDMERMAAYNISIGRIISILQSENMSIPGGSIDLGNKKFNVLTSGLYKSLDDISNTVINTGPEGILRLKDVATVEFDYDKPEVLARLNGKEALWLSVEQKSGINIYNLSDNIDEKIDGFKETLPDNIRIETVLKQADGVKERVNGFFMNFLQGILLVGIIIFVALGARPSLIVMIAIPVSVFVGIGLIDVSGYGIQQMSIAGLIIALGMLVDSSIAMVENIYRYINLGLKPKEAAIKGASEIGGALVSSTITTILAFAPMLMMGNDVGDFIRSMILIVIYTLTIALFVALCLTPFISSKVLKKKKERKKDSLLKRFIDNYYTKWLKSALNRPKLVVIISLLIFLGSISLLPLIGVSFFPKAEKSQLMITVKGIEGSNLGNTEKAVKYVESIVNEYPKVKKVASTIGEGNPQVYYNMLKPNPSSKIGQVFVVLESSVLKNMDNIIADLRKEFDNYPGAKIEVKEFVQGPPVDAPVQIRLFSDDLDDLKSVASDVEEIFMNVPGIININNPYSVDKTDLKININREKAGKLGVNIADIDVAVRAVVNGLDVGNYQDKFGEKYDIVVKAPEQDIKDLNWINKTYVSNFTGTQIKLSQVVDIEFDKNIKRIDHYDLERYVSIMADVDENIQSIDKATKQVIAQLDQYEFPKSTTYMVGGEQESRSDSFGGLGQSLLIALLGIFAVLVLQFKSFKQPLIIFTAIPLSITGAFLTLMLLGYSFSFMAFVGLTSLMGIVINSSIILVDYANQLKSDGLNTLQAVIEASRTRFNPIFLTTITTVAGLLPLTVLGGKMWAPMGWAIIGGLIFSTLLTLVLVPVLYLLFSNGDKKLVAN